MFTPKTPMGIFTAAQTGNNRNIHSRDAQMSVYPFNRILSNKKEQISETHNNMEELQKHYFKRKEPDITYILHDFIHMEFKAKVKLQ